MSHSTGHALPVRKKLLREPNLQTRPLPQIRRPQGPPFQPLQQTLRALGNGLLLLPPGRARAHPLSRSLPRTLNGRPEHDFPKLRRPQGPCSHSRQHHPAQHQDLQGRRPHQVAEAALQDLPEKQVHPRFHLDLLPVQLLLVPVPLLHQDHPDSQVRPENQVRLHQLRQLRCRILHHDSDLETSHVLPHRRLYLVLPRSPAASPEPGVLAHGLRARKQHQL